MGPAPIVNGQVPGDSGVTGHISAVAGHPTDANTIYVAAGGGGVWKTVNGGTNWTALTDVQATLFMGAIALAPTDPNTIYAGTGDASNSGASFYGRGVLKSTDAGATWSLLGTNVFDRRTIAQIVVDPTNPNIVFVALGGGGGVNGVGGGTGIWKSIDGGSSWTNTTTAISTFDAFSDLAIDPSNPQILFAAAGTFFGDGVNGVYKTTNGGMTWAPAGDFPMGASNGRIRIALAKSSPQTVYASIINPSTGAVLKIMKTTNGGTSWLPTPAAPPNYTTDIGWYATTLGLDPINANIVYAGGSNAFVKSSDGGATWQDIDVGLGGNNGTFGNHQAIAFDANGKVLAADDGGVWRLNNPTVGSIQWDDLTGNLGVTRFVGIALHPSNANVAFGGNENHGVVKFNDHLGWTQVRDRNSGIVRIDPLTPTTIYHILDSTEAAYFERSDNGGVNWSSKTSGINLADPKNFYSPFVLDPSLPTRLFLGTNRVYESVNRGDAWAPISTPNTNGWNSSAAIDAVAIAKTAPSTIYATAGGKIFVTTNTGSSWNERSIAGFGDHFQTLLVDPTNSLIAYAVRDKFTNGSGGHVFRTTNGGVTWTDISTGLPDLPTYAIAFDPRTSPGVLFVGMDNGVYASGNPGNTWIRLGSGLPNVQVRELALNTNLSILAAGTHGRGMWQISVPPQLNVVGSIPAVASSNSTPPASYTVNLSFVADPASLQPSDFTVNAIPATSVSLNGAGTAATFEFSDNPVTSQGLQMMQIAAGAISPLTPLGYTLAEFSGTFFFDQVPMSVISTTPPVNGIFTVPTALDYVINFNEAIASDSIGVDDLALSVGSVIAAAATGPSQATYTFSPFTFDGSLTVRLSAGAVADSFGNPNVAAFSESYSIDFATASFPISLGAKIPLGSLAYDATIPGSILNSGDTDTYTINFDPSQQVALVLHPTTPGWRPTLTLTVPGSPIFMASAPTEDQDAVLQGISTMLGGLTSIAVGAVGAGSGDYTLQVLLNSALELEGHSGPSNDTLATAQDLEATTLTLANTASRLAVTAAIGPAIASENFESGALPAPFTTFSSNSFGRIRVMAPGSSGNTSAFALVMDTTEDAVSTLNEAIYHVNLSGVNQATLSFSHNRFADEANALPTDFMGHVNCDGVAISPDGTNWRTILSAPTSSTWTTFSIDLVAAAAAAGMTLGPDFQIKFQQFDNFPIPSDGRGFDNILIEVPDRDYFKFTMAAGDIVAVSTTALTAGKLNLELLSSSDVVLATGIGGFTNLTDVISNFTAVAAGQFYARIGGDPGTPYSLIITRNAAFDTEPNDNFAAAENFTGFAGALGHSSNDDWYAVDVNHTIVKLRFETKTPVVGTTFDPHIGLYDPAGALVAAGIDMADGRNETIEYNPSEIGLYRLRVSSENSQSGDYFLSQITELRFSVSAVSPTPTGFTATFTTPFDPSVINLYDAFGTFGVADVTLVHDAAPSLPIRGSLLINPSNTSITFVKSGTGPAGVLQAGIYVVILRSAADGFKDMQGNLLDGNSDGTPGDNFITTFTVGPTPSMVLSIPDFARGPDSASPIKLPNNTGTGIPVLLSASAGVTDLTFDLNYNPALLNFTGTLNGPPGGTFELISNTSGVASFHFSLGTASPLGANATLGQIVATVPDSATSSYKTKQLLHLSNIVATGGSGGPPLANDAVHVVAYFGDATGDAAHSGGDASAIMRVSANLDSGPLGSGLIGGFAAYPLLDPPIIGDLNTGGAGTVDGTDVTLINSYLSGTPRPQIPTIPPSLSSLSALGLGAAGEGFGLRGWGLAGSGSGAGVAAALDLAGDFKSSALAQDDWSPPALDQAFIALADAKLWFEGATPSNSRSIPDADLTTQAKSTVAEMPWLWQTDGLAQALWPTGGQRSDLKKLAKLSPKMPGHEPNLDDELEIAQVIEAARLP